MTNWIYHRNADDSTHENQHHINKATIESHMIISIYIEKVL